MKPTWTTTITLNTAEKTLQDQIMQLEPKTSKKYIYIIGLEEVLKQVEGRNEKKEK